MHKRLGVALVAVLAACSSGGGERAAETTTTAPPSTTTTSTTEAPTTTTTTTAPPALVGFAVPPGGDVRAVITPTGVVAPVLGPDPGGFVVRTPCGGTAVATGFPLNGATVVLDPGHGATSRGRWGPTGWPRRT